MQVHGILSVQEIFLLVIWEKTRLAHLPDLFEGRGEKGNVV